MALHHIAGERKLQLPQTMQRGYPPNNNVVEDSLSRHGHNPQKLRFVQSIFPHDSNLTLENVTLDRFIDSWGLAQDAKFTARLANLLAAIHGSSEYPFSISVGCISFWPLALAEHEGGRETCSPTLLVGPYLGVSNASFGSKRLMWHPSTGDMHPTFEDIWRLVFLTNNGALRINEHTDANRADKAISQQWRN